MEGWRNEGTGKRKDGAGQQCCLAPSGCQVPGQDTVRAVSSTTKLVCNEESSFIRNFTVTDLPR